MRRDTRLLIGVAPVAAPSAALAAPPPTAVVTMGDVSALAPPSQRGSQWGRAVSAATIAQGQTQELLHPNAYGQMALGTCIGALYAAQRGSYACSGKAGSAPGEMRLQPLG